MLKELIAQGNTVEDAIEAGCLELGIDRDDAGIEVVEYPKSKTFGLFGGAPAKVRVYFDDGVEEPKKTVKKTAAKEPPAKEPPKKESPKKDSPKPAVKAQPKEEPAKEAKPAVKSDSPPANSPGRVIEDESALNPGEPPLSSAIYLRNILAGMGAEATVTIRVEDEHTGNLDVTGPQMGALIGRHGEISAALQYLVSLASNSKKGNNYYRISVNIGKYRQRRDGIIEDLATKTAERSLRIGKNIAFEPMNPYERRVVHTTIQGVEGASSWSMGEGSERHVVVGPAGVREGEEGLPPRRDYNNRGYNRNGFRRDDDRRGGGYDSRSRGGRDAQYNKNGFRRDDRRSGYGGGYDRHSDIKTMPNDYNNRAYDRGDTPRPEPKKDVQAPLYGRIQVPKKEESNNEQ